MGARWSNIRPRRTSDILVDTSRLLHIRARNKTMFEYASCLFKIFTNSLCICVPPKVPQLGSSSDSSGTYESQVAERPTYKYNKKCLTRTNCPLLETKLAELISTAGTEARMFAVWTGWQARRNSPNAVALIEPRPLWHFLYKGERTDAKVN